MFKGLEHIVIPSKNKDQIIVVGQRMQYRGWSIKTKINEAINYF